MCFPLPAHLQTTAEDNYDGPDMTYYLDKKELPPDGPDDATRDHNGQHSAGVMKSHYNWWASQQGMF